MNLSHYTITVIVIGFIITVIISRTVVMLVTVKVVSST